MTAHRRTALVATLLGFFIVMLDTTIVNVALADWGSALTSTRRWAHCSGSSTLTPSCSPRSFSQLGPHATVSGPAGSTSLAWWSLLCSRPCAPSLPQAGSSSLVAPSRAWARQRSCRALWHCCRLCTTIRRNERRAIGLWGGAGGVAAAIGPVLGGALVSTIGWRAVFWVNLPIVAIGCLLTLWAIPALTGSRARRVDLPGQVLSVLTLVAVTYAVITAGEHGWSPWQVAVLIAGGVFLALFVHRRATTPGPDAADGLVHSCPVSPWPQW